MIDLDHPKGDVQYRGTERRKVADRRVGHDRRDEIRFEMKEDRRSGKDRRKRSGWDGQLMR